VGRVIDGVQIERQVARRAVEGGDELIDEDIAQALEGLDGDGVLEAGQRRLAGQVVVVRGAVGDQLEDGVGAQGVVVVPVLVAGEDAKDTGKRTISRKVCSVRSRSRRSSRAPAKARVSPMCWSNWRMGSSPASPESWPADGSMTSGVPKKSRTYGQADGILMGRLREREKAGRLTRLDAHVGERFRSPARGSGCADITQGLSNPLVKPMTGVTRILSAIDRGDPHLAEQLLPLVHDELLTLVAQRQRRYAQPTPR
jgi:hypothetical protein